MKKDKFFWLLLVLSAAVFWYWWLPGIRIANDLPVALPQTLQSLLDYPRIWSEFGSEGLGQYILITLWSWPFNSLVGVLANAGLGFAIVERLMLIIPFLLIGSAGIWQLGKDLRLSPQARFISGLAYLLNSYILMVIDGGQLSVALAYAMFPASSLLIKRSIGKSWDSKILAALGVWVLGVFDIRFVLLLALLIMLNFVWELFAVANPKQFLIEYIKLGILSGLVFTGLNFYWLLPLILSPLSSDTFATLTQANFNDQVTLAHPFLLLAPHWFQNIFGIITLIRWQFLAIPFLVFGFLFFKQSTRQAGFWLLVAILGIFLGKGAAEPLSGVYPWVFAHIPGFSLFRDSSKFFFFISLSYSLLIGVTIDLIKSRRFLVPIVSIYLLMLVSPVWLRQTNGTFNFPPFQKQAKALESYFANKPYGRVFWIPALSTVGFYQLEHPAVEAARLVSKRPFAVGIKGGYETFNFLREASWMGEIFDVAGIEYVSYPYPDSKRQDLSPDKLKYYYQFLDQLSRLPWLKRVNLSGSWPVLQTKIHQQRLFGATNFWWVIGSDDIYQKSTTNANLKLSQNPLVFVQENQSLGNKLSAYPEAKIVLNNKTENDLAATFLPANKLIYPASILKHDPDGSGWWKRTAPELINWRDFLHNKYGIDNQDFDLGGGWAVAEGARVLHLQNPGFKKGRILLARVMESSRSGSVNFLQLGQMVGQINTIDQRPANFLWHEVGKLNSDGELTVDTSGEINVVNALAVVSPEYWQSLQNKTKELAKNGRVVDFNAGNTRPPKFSVSFKMVNPTKYIINVSGLSGSGFLVFSESYDTNWRLNGQDAIPVYSLLNGFTINRNGSYTLEYSPQHLVEAGLPVSGLSAVFIILAYFYFRKRSLKMKL